MKHLTYLVLLSCLLTVHVVQSQAQSNEIQKKIEEAISAAPTTKTPKPTNLQNYTEPAR